MALRILLALYAAGTALAAPHAAATQRFPVEVDPSGCELELIAGGDGANHVFHQGVSPDGRRVAIGWDRKEGDVTSRGAYLLDLTTRRRRELPGLNNAPAFSPDGRRLVSANYPGAPDLRTEVVELDLRSGRLTSLAPDPAMEWLPSYSPDGRWVVFNSFRTGASDLYRVGARGDAPVERLTADDRYEAHGVVSPDGRRVLFHRQVQGADYGLALLDLQSRAVRELPGGPGEEAYPAWAPGGTRISFSADEGQVAGQGDIYLGDAEGRPLRRLTAHPAKDAYSAWSPDGRWIYFVSFREGGSRIYRIRIIRDDCRRS